jgi:hypothetical protein
MNTIPCGQCTHFDQGEKYRGNKRVDVWYGWCKKRSVYPDKEWDEARPFDVDVKRVAKGATRSQPLIVEPDSVKVDCTVAMKGAR